MKAIYSYEIKTGASTLFGISQNEERVYPLPNPVEAHVLTDAGTLLARTEAGFKFDGRSGPSLVDWFVPNLGSFDERLGWWLHDALAYGQSLSFSNTNLFLKLWLRDMCGYGLVKRNIVHMAVSLTDDWYGWPTPDDTWYCNVGKVHTEWRPNG